MLPEKDVAALLNLKTGKLVCSSRNVNGAFHLYHTSCLINWILLCELETIESHKVNPIVRRRYRRKNGAKCNEMGKDLETKPMGFLISSILCPECQGTGIEVEDDKLKSLISLCLRYKIKVSDGRRAWMKSPEMLESCSTGFHFPSLFGEMVQEKVLPLKFLHFYSADNCECGSSLVG
ncbi:Putative pterin-4-alpha-carbinolamine dehydratase [Gossypium arboreum]|uniref:Putative pterin-4-alpha-carbinolamine dehydratase n=1 Tax=Gossypium arboreum TaxID=29729 RepID=A0A0B0MHS7_GOSAR|nr:Putative pterin-4-alpha-carbinolamine dehydratase [Gossypium arboreum]